MSRLTRPSLAVVAPAVLVVVCAALAAWLLLGDDRAPVAREDGPVTDVTAQGPRFADLDELMAASDIIVDGVVTGIDDGRVLTDPADPETGIVTQLARIEVRRVVRQGDEPLVVEQEAALLDGTRLRVNGILPLVAGDRGLMFLVRGDGDEFPYTAFVNEQGWIPIVDDRLVPVDPDDPIGASLSGFPASRVTIP